MKKIVLSLVLTCLLFAFNPYQSNAATNAATSSLVVSKPSGSAEAKVLLLRLDKIKTMDKSNLNSSEKKDLRKEVRSIKAQLRDISGGVYISAGLLIVILIVLIVLT
jgi:hypothetical protein